MFNINGSRIVREIETFRAHKAKKGITKLMWRLNNRAIRALSGQKLVFISTREVFDYSQRLSLRFIDRYDVVCAIPRSGFMLGSLFATRLNVPLSTPEFLSKRLFWNISGIQNNEYLQNAENVKRALLVDDSVGSGKAINDAEEDVLKGYPKAEITRVAFLCNSATRKFLDHCAMVVNVDTIFEWCLPSYYKGWVASDMDGVICDDCPGQVARNESAYRKWIRNVKPLFVPKYPFVAIVSNRLEKYRAETEAWLMEHNVKYDALHLSRSASDASHKFRIIRSIQPRFFIESDVHLAQTLWKETGVPVLCFDRMIMFS